MRAHPNYNIPWDGLPGFHLRAEILSLYGVIESWICIAFNLSLLAFLAAAISPVLSCVANIHSTRQLEKFFPTLTSLIGRLSLFLLYGEVFKHGRKRKNDQINPL